MKIAIIGSGFSGISAATYLAAAGHQVHVYEKNAEPGGRARQFRTESGYLFDMGPSWYWMPDVYERFFRDFGCSVSDYYTLEKLNPSFEIVYGKNDTLRIPADFESLCDMFENLEAGSSAQLRRFMKDAEKKYSIAMKEFVFKPGLSWMEYADFGLIQDAFKLHIFSSLSTHVRRYFSNPKILVLMEFPVLFLGAEPKQTPALYSLMNYAGLCLGTWYPRGGFGSVVQAMISLAKSRGAVFYHNVTVEAIPVQHNLAQGIVVNGSLQSFDVVLATADYHHVEQSLLEPRYRNYDESYWSTKTLAPTCLIYYLGISRKIENLQHHTLFFDKDLNRHAHEIYNQAQWPSDPLFYVCCPSKSDDTVAPAGHENLFLLMPIATDLVDTPEKREEYFQIIMRRLEEQIGQSILPSMVYKKSYCIRDFVLDYNSYKGNAYGLANTLGQTAVFKPKIRNKKLKNLFYAGHLTVPGPGVPPAIISGKIAAEQIKSYAVKLRNESII